MEVEEAEVDVNDLLSGELYVEQLHVYGLVEGHTLSNIAHDD